MALISVKLRALSATVATAMLLVGLPVRPAAADYISSELGDAGSWTVLGIGTDGRVTMTGGSVVGNVGVAGGRFTFTDGAITGGVAVGAGVTVTRTGGSLTEGIKTGIDLSSDVSAATSASNAFAVLATTQNVSGNRINGTTTINAANPGGRNVIDLSEVILTGQVLTLNGPPGSEFVLNDSGAMRLTSSEIVLTGGLTANDVVFNDTGTRGVTMTGGVLDGIILAPDASVRVTSGLVNGEIIGGDRITLNSGQVVETPAAPAPVLGTGLPAFALVGGCLLLARLLRRRAAGGQPMVAAGP